MLIRMADSLHHREMSRFIVRLALNCKFRHDRNGVWYHIEQILRRTLHLMTLTDLLQIRYVFVVKSPKVGSLDLRNQIDKLVADEFKLLSMDELQLFMMAQAGTASLTNFHLVMETLKKRAPEINSQAKQRGPELLVNFFYTYCISRVPEKRRKKTRGVEPDMEKEANQVLDLFGDQILTNFSKLSTAAVYRLAFCLEVSGLRETREYYWR